MILKNNMIKKINTVHALYVLVCLSALPYCFGQVDSQAESNAPIFLTFAQKEGPNDPLFFIDGQLCQHLREIYQDKAGNLWFGTNVYDLMMYNGDSLQYIGEKEGFSGSRVTGICEDQAGNIWFATGNGLNKYDGKSFTIFTEKNGLENSEIWSLHIDSDDIIWIGHNEGLSSFDGQNFENITVPKSSIKEPNIIYSENRITAIIEGHEGNLWLGTDGYGICQFDGDSFTHVTTEDGLCDNTIAELMADSKGAIWIGTFHGGVSKYDGEKFLNYTQDGVTKGSEVGGFYEDTNGDIWFAAENNGVYKYDGEEFSHYYKEDGLNSIVLSIFRDKENRFWFGGWGGLFRYDGIRFTPVTQNGPWE